MSAFDETLPRRVVVTGGATGIGFAVAKLFADAGSCVGLIGRTKEALNRAVEELGGSRGSGQIVAVAADVTDEQGLQDAIAQVADALGGIDALVTCAGVEGEMGASCDEVTAHGFREVLDINVVGTYLAIKHALPYLKASSGASVTMIGSDSGFVAVPGMLAYNASKGALLQLTRALAFELFEDHGIRVNSVCPSIVDTPMARRGLGDEAIEEPNFPLQSPGDVAWSVAYLTSARSRAVNGINLLSDFGYTGRSSFPA